MESSTPDAGSGSGSGSGSALALVPDAGSEGQLCLVFEVAGETMEVALGRTGLELDADMPMEAWLELGKQLGDLDRRTRWWIGDWLNFGEASYGEDSAQGVDDPASRYDHMNRVTGLEQQTLMNIRSICGKVARSRRREELGFWIHSEVAPLEPDEQTYWLEQAVANRWNRVELRAAIRASKADPDPGDDPLDEDGGGKDPSLSERLAIAARLVYNQSQRATDGSFIVPAEAMAQLAAALGES